VETLAAFVETPAAVVEIPAAEIGRGKRQKTVQNFATLAGAAARAAAEVPPAGEAGAVVETLAAVVETPAAVVKTPAAVVETPAAVVKTPAAVTDGAAPSSAAAVLGSSCNPPAVVKNAAARSSAQADLSAWEQRRGANIIMLERKIENLMIRP
jgi:hypothetical protein